MSIVRSSKVVECPKMFMWENIHDVIGLDDDFSSLGHTRFNLHTTPSSIETYIRYITPYFRYLEILKERTMGTELMS